MSPSFRSTRIDQIALAIVASTFACFMTHCRFSPSAVALARISGQSVMRLGGAGMQAAVPATSTRRIDAPLDPARFPA
jgi:hypothetical protein